MGVCLIDADTLCIQHLAIMTIGHKRDSAVLCVHEFARGVEQIVHKWCLTNGNTSVVIELQPVKTGRKAVNPVMYGVAQGMAGVMYGLGFERVTMYPARNKLTPFGLVGLTYPERKAGILWVAKLFVSRIEPTGSEYAALLFDDSRKCDDLADAYVQAVVFCARTMHDRLRCAEILSMGITEAVGIY